LARLSSSLLEFSESAAKQYYKAMAGSPAEEYLLTTRGLSKDSLAFFKLGYVASPVSGHEKYRGCLSIPYITKAGVVGIRYRRIGDGDGPKYLSEPGAESRLFNPAGFFRHERFICLCEGEIDTVSAWQCGLPAVGVPGVKSWKPFMGKAFDGYEAVFILTDKDDKGQGEEFADKAAAHIRNARIIPMESGGVGMDVNKFMNDLGAEALIKKIGVEL
jgi:DNA primase